MKFTTEEGKEYEFRGEYRVPTSDDCVLKQGECYPQIGPIAAYGIRAIVHPIRRQHTFGGVVFEETGAKREVHQDEWFLYEYVGQKPLVDHWAGADASFVVRTIIRPISIEPGV